MDQRAADLQTRITTVTSFGNVVNAMRGVASSRARRARALINGVDSYASTVTDAMAQAITLMSPASGERPRSGTPPVCIMFCAEQGFNGGFNELVLASLATAGSDRVMLLGSQGLALARARGIEPEWFAPMISHADAAIGASERLRAALAQTLLSEPSGKVDMIYAQLLNGARFSVRRHRLLPLDLGGLDIADGQPPLVHLSPPALIQELTQEYIAALLARAMLHSHAAENLSRLSAMAAAHENVVRMGAQLQADEQRLRQEMITAEIVELAAGHRAVRRAQ